MRYYKKKSILIMEEKRCIIYQFYLCGFCNFQDTNFATHYTIVYAMITRVEHISIKVQLFF